MEWEQSWMYFRFCDTLEIEPGNIFKNGPKFNGIYSMILSRDERYDTM